MAEPQASTPSPNRKPFEAMPNAAVPGDPARSRDQRHTAPRFGDFYAIPNEDTHLPGPGTHPWCVIEPHTIERATVIVCLRSSSDRGGPDRLATPARVLPTLDLPGNIILPHNQPLLVGNFKHYEYLGRLEMEWLHKLRAAVDARTQRIANGAEERWS